MKYSVALVAAVLAGVAQAQEQCLGTAAQIPQCGTSCLTSAGSNVGCNWTDFACQCSHQAQINNAALSSCVLSACNNDPTTALEVSSSAIALCNCVSGLSGGPATAAAATTAAIPATTAAVTGGSTPTTTPKASAAAGTSAAAPKASSSVKASHFTGGAAYASGAVGGVFAGILGVVAAL